MEISYEQRQELRKLYNHMVDNYNESDDLTDARAYDLYLKGMKDTLRVFGITIEDLKNK